MQLRIRNLVLAGAMAVSAAAARGDTIAMSGQLTKLPGELVNYNFTITSTFSPLFGGEVTDTIGGLATITTKNGQLLATQFFDPSNIYIFQAQGDSIGLAEFAVYKPNNDPYVLPDLLAKYDFIATGLNQVQIVFTKGNDPEVQTFGPTATPEPMPLLLLAIGGLWIVLAVKYRNPAR